VKIFLSKIGIRRYYGYELNKLINKDKRIVCIPNIYELQHIMEQCFCLVSYFKIPHANLALAESIILKTVAVAAETEESQEYSNGGRLAFLFKMNNPDEFVDAVNNVFVHYTSMKERLKAESNTIALLFDKNNNIAQLNTVYESLIENKEFI
jgi:glycosyltransferase involved in cell wall biosynthesis